jgi:hypothetical protein
MLTIKSKRNLPFGKALVLGIWVGMVLLFLHLSRHWPFPDQNIQLSSALKPVAHTAPVAPLQPSPSYALYFCSWSQQPPSDSICDSNVVTCENTLLETKQKGTGYHLPLLLVQKSKGLMYKVLKYWLV